jgi:hypothetical protein
MTITGRLDVAVALDPEAQLEDTLIEEFLHAKGLNAALLRTLTPEDAGHVLADASRYASGRLAEVVARAHFVHELHGEKDSRSGGTT